MTTNSVALLSEFKSDRNSYGEQSVSECSFDEAISILSALYFDENADSDSYYFSPFYYRFTGRNGIKVFKLRTNYLITCVHPNLGECKFFCVNASASS